MLDAYLFTRKSKNAKTGPIPVTSSPQKTCPATCPLKNAGCYADTGPMGAMWRSLSIASGGDTFWNGRGSVTTVTWRGLCESVANLPDGTLWRHNQMGDLPQYASGRIDANAVQDLVDANAGRRGFTYTHHDVESCVKNRHIVRKANDSGFTINLSANNLAHADRLADLEAGPVVTVLPRDAAKNTITPAGRRVVVCPATVRDDVTCAKCKLCARVDRDVIVGFPAHGATAKKADRVAKSETAR